MLNTSSTTFWALYISSPYAQYVFNNFLSTVHRYSVCSIHLQQLHQYYTITSELHCHTSVTQLHLYYTITSSIFHTTSRDLTTDMFFYIRYFYLLDNAASIAVYLHWVISFCESWSSVRMTRRKETQQKHSTLQSECQLSGPTREHENCNITRSRSDMSQLAGVTHYA